MSDKAARSLARGIWILGVCLFLGLLANAILPRWELSNNSPRPVALFDRWTGTLYQHGDGGWEPIIKLE